MRAALCVLLLCLLVLPAVALQIVEFCPDPYRSGDPDEYIVLEGEGSLAGYTVTDGEGGFRFPAGACIQGRLVVARDAAAYERTYGTLPHYELFDHSPLVPEVIRGDDLRMGNERDELVLLANGEEIQRVSWPGDVHPREGQIHFLEEGVWDPRVLLIGQSRFPPATFHDVSLTAFAAPDASLEVFYAAVRDADDEILVNVYEFTSPDLALALADASARGVQVRMLLEGGPVGGIAPAERYVCSLMMESGIPIHQMSSGGDAHPKYRFNHAKYMVIDGEGLFITSENFKENGFPPAGSSGNRGWGVYLESPALAEYFREVFLWDSSGGDIVPMDVHGGSYAPPVYAPYTVEFPPARFEGATVTAVLAPDTSRLIREMLEGAETSIDIEQAYITNRTPAEPNPFLAAAIEAARRGVKVRVLLDSYWYNTEDAADNDEMAAYINRVAEAEGLPLAARCADLGGNRLEKIHNKGVIVDGRRVLVSSVNWNENSPNFNRESGVIIDHPGVAAYFGAVFEDDWTASERHAAGAVGRDWGRIAAAMAVLAALLALYVHRRRR